MKKLICRCLQVMHALVLGIALLWCAGLWCYLPISLITVAAVACAWGALYLHRRRRPQHTAGWLWALVVCCITTFCALPGPAQVQWQRSWAKAPTFELNHTDNTLTVHNLRDFRYRSVQDFDSVYRTEHYDLSQLTGADFAECHWDGMEAICHTMMSFHFADGRNLVVSAETRLPEGVEQNAIGGLYKQYGLLYIFGTEDDIFRLRTDYRHEDLYLMPLRCTPAQARAMLLHFVSLQQETARNNTPYNTVTHNCSTGLINTFAGINPHMTDGHYMLPIHNGSISRILFENGAFQSLPGETYDAFRRRTYLGYDIMPEQQHQSYSQAIRAKITPQP